MIGRIVRPGAFERVLRMRSHVTSAHFALHHLPERPATWVLRLASAPGVELSTGIEPVAPSPVDEPVDKSPPLGLWLGLVVPKRHARRAVTRSLLKRQIRAAMLRHGASLAHGLWVVRLRSPFDRASFPSAASGELKRVARAELDQVLADAADSRAISRRAGRH